MKLAALSSRAKPDATTIAAPLLAMRVIPPHHIGQNDQVRLVTAMHSLVVDERHPIALELIGTTQQRGFVIRATTTESLQHVIHQLRARYPQAVFLPLPASEDPFRLETHEVVSALELQAGEASYLPLQSWNDQTAEQEGADPLLGLLAALDGVPENTRIVAQLALAPAAANWSHKDQRKAVEHALEPERNAQRQALSQQYLTGGAPSTPLIILGMIVIALLIGYTRFKSWLPVWVDEAFTTQLHGKLPQLTQTQTLQYYGGMGLIIILILACFWLFTHIHRSWGKRPLYNMQLVQNKTMRMAYRVRLRIYVIEPALNHPLPRGTRVRELLQAWRHDWHMLTTTEPGAHRSHLGREGLQTLIAMTVHSGPALARACQNLWHYITQVRARSQRRTILLAQMLAAYRQYHLAAGNYFVPRRLGSREAHHAIQAGTGLARLWSGWWQGVRTSSHLIDVETLAALWHLPPDQTLGQLAQMEQQQMRTFPLPAALIGATEAPFSFGISEHAGHQQPFAFPTECLQRHLFIGGKSGEGKSTCMEHLARTAMHQGGLLVIDPHGDLAEHILALVPSHRIDDVLLIDLSDPDYAVGLNPLDATLGRGRDKAIADLLKTLAHIWASSWGPRMENAFEYALRTLFEVNKALVQQNEHQGPTRQYTLLDVMHLLTDESFCHSLLEQVSDPFILRWWTLYYDLLNPSMQRERTDPVLSKVAKFESVIARRILGQSQSTLNFSQAIAQEKIILVKLAKGVVGEDVTRLLGSTLLGLIQITLEEQGALAIQERKRLCIMVDEFQTFRGVDWAALAELRKYGAAFYLATQSPEYLVSVHDQLLPMVLANVKQYILFHVSARDAQLLHQEIGVEAEDLATLDSYRCYIKLTYQNRRLPAFSITMDPPPSGDEDLARRIRHDSQRRYGVAVNTIDSQLQEALIRAIASQPHQGLVQSGSTKVHMATRQADANVQPTERIALLPGPENETPKARESGYRGRKSQETARSSGDEKKHAQPMSQVWTDKNAPTTQVQERQ
ncbi:type IV secretory system conjugative DNA transfer family protein [Tengunoibacter tsumagoiensis]|uniref:Helicase HerA central domain-containing protein n=1 Tax=Tengunoibacter tsumagoiensis TaxID=2014871 RepID=A0A402A096_9CHLR|nr:DUF87 domain-containing protein [Tengunoibacter tsumagoiensis]GCE12515.1 hypothetical protein KTT_23740 [Tengunoibacter tsumagoiensis]